MIETDRYRDTPKHCLVFKVRSSDRDPVRGLHQGQRSYPPRQQAGHMTATCNDQHQIKSTLAKQEPSTHDSAGAPTGKRFPGGRKGPRRLNCLIPGANGAHVWRQLLGDPIRERVKVGSVHLVHTDQRGYPLLHRHRDCWTKATPLRLLLAKLVDDQEICLRQACFYFGSNGLDDPSIKATSPRRILMAG